MENIIIEQLMNRKSMRIYEETPIEPEKVNAIIDAAMRAPTAGNMMLYTILNITSQEVKDKLAVTCDNQPFIAKAPLVLIFVADYHRWYLGFQKETPNTEELRKLGMGDMLLACSDALIAAQSAVVAADALGLGSCYIGDIIENFEIHKELLNLPPHTAPIGMVCFGYPTQGQKDRVQTTRFAKEDMVFENKYPNVSEHETCRFTTSDDIGKILSRKFNAEFSLEMNRSSEEIYNSFKTK